MARLATSSVTRRRWQIAGEPAHHLIDPRTSAPAVTPVACATVVARTAVEALLAYDPDYTIEILRLNFASKYQDPTVPERYLEDLRQAGLPEE